MTLTIVHIGGTSKEVEWVDFDAPRPWVRVRYPGGGGLFVFSLAHGGIECKRKELPQWRLSDPDLATLRAQAKALGIKFTAVPFARGRLKPLPGSPRKKPDQRQMELFK